MASADVARNAAGQIYAEYAREQVNAQESYKESIERRAMAVITSSSTITALLFAFAAFINGGPTHADIPRLASSTLAAALTMFVLAAATALYVNAPRAYEGPSADALNELLDEAWRQNESAETAGHRVAATRIVVLRTAKKQNARKARLLTWAIGFELGAIAGLAAAVIFAFSRV